MSEKEPPAHEHQWKYVRTDASWWDGDEDDVYKCSCGETKYVYIPR